MNKSLRIIIENENFNFLGGSETVAIGTFELLKRKGHDCFFFATDKKPYYIDDYEYIKYFPKNVYSVKDFLKNPINYFYNFEAKKNLKNMIKEVKPDIVHFNLLTSPSIIQACHDMNIPSILTLHVPHPFCPASTFMYENKEICTDVKCKNNKFYNCVLHKCKNNSYEACTRKMILSYIYAYTKSFHKISYFIAPSNAIRELCIKSDCGINENNSTVIPNFLTKKQLEIQPNYSNKKYFLYSGRLEKEKGLWTLVNIFKDLPEDIKLHVAGTGSIENDLKLYVENNKIKNIIFNGFLSKDELENEYKNCIALIVPSEWFEIFGMINIEAYINGKPVIACNVGGIPEVVEHNKTGFLFPFKDSEKLKQYILKYWNNPDLVIEHGKKAYIKAREYYNEDFYYSKLMSVYEKVLKNK